MEGERGTAVGTAVVRIPNRASEAVTYEILETGGVRASHLPEAGFQKTPGYALENERRYHDEPASQRKVQENAANLDPAFLLESVDANHGAPVIDRQGNVLGGNGRAMSVRLAYEKFPQRAAAYREALRGAARRLGLDPARVDGMERPVLVRRLERDLGPEERQKLVSALNDTFTDSKDRRASGKSRGDRLSRGTLEALASGMAEADTLRQYFDDPASAGVVDLLIQDGVIQKTERNAYVGADGLLNPDGKRVVEEALRGRVARSYEALAALPGPVLAKIDAAIPHLLIAEGVGGTWDITRHMRDAIDLLMEFRASGGKSTDAEVFLGQADMTKGDASPTERYSQAARALFRMAMGMPKAAFAGAFARYAGHAKASPEAGGIPGVALTQERAAREFLGIEPETGKEERKAAAKAAPAEPPSSGRGSRSTRTAAFEKTPSKDLGEEAKGAGFPDADRRHSNTSGDRSVDAAATAVKPGDADKERLAELFAARDFVLEGKPVASLSGREFQKGEGALIDRVATFFDSLGGYAESPVLGRVALQRKGVKSSVAHGIGAKKAAAFAAVKDVIEQGKVFDRNENWKGRGHDTAVIVAPIQIGTDQEGREDYVCEVVVKRIAGKNSFYLHEVNVRSLLSDTIKTPTGGVSIGEPARPVRSILAQRLAEVNKPRPEGQAYSSGVGSLEAPAVPQTFSRTRGDGQRIPPSHSEGVETSISPAKAEGKPAPAEPPAKGADPFGPAYAAFSGKPAEAIEHLLKVRQGHVPAAFHKEGLGDIDLPWGKGGKGGFGLAHIIERRNESGVDGEEFARSLPKLIREGKVEKRPNYPGRAYIVSEKQESAIRLEWNGEKRNWIVTAYPLNKETLEATGGLRTSAHAYGDKQSFPLPHSEGVETSIPPVKPEGKAQAAAKKPESVPRVTSDADRPSRNASGDHSVDAATTAVKPEDKPARAETAKDGQKPEAPLASLSSDRKAAAHAAWRQLQRDTEQWARQVEAFEGSTQTRKLLEVCRTPDVLLKLKEPDVPMVMTAGNLAKILSDKENHQLPKSLVAQLPAALAEPVMIFESATVSDALVVLTDLTHEGRPVMVAIHPDVERQRIQVHDITSAYKRAKEWFLRQMEDGRLLYQDKKKSLAWARTNGLQLPQVRKLPAKLENRLLTEADIVKPEAPTGERPLASLASAGGGERRAYPYNGREVGSITPEIAARLHLDKPGPIVLDDTGLRHIEERHGEQIRGLGFADARSFVRFVLAQVDAVYDVDGKGRKYDVVTRAMTPMGRVMVRLEFAEEGDFYSVATAGPLRKNQYANKKPLWEGAHSTRFPEETPWATRRASQRGQSGDSRQSAANGPTVEASGGGVNLAAGPDTTPVTVVEVDSSVVPRSAKARDLAKWLKSYFEDKREVTILSTGKKVRFSNGNLETSLKRSREASHNQAYAGLSDLVRLAEFDSVENRDERHPNLNGQEVYYSALRIGESLYAVKMKFDVPSDKESNYRKTVLKEESIEDLRYKDHTLREIEIAPVLYREPARNNAGFTQTTRAIDKVSLGVLRNAVKPSRLEGGTLSSVQAAGRFLPRTWFPAGWEGATEHCLWAKRLTCLSSLACRISPCKWTGLFSTRLLEEHPNRGVCTT